MKSYLLADDLSGALEAGATLRKYEPHVDIPLRASRRNEGIEVISTETRNASPVLAAEIVNDLLRKNRRVGRRLLFKKIDSTLRGPIAAELTVTLEALEPSLIIFCPANPATGRIVVDGHVFVRGTPLAQTPFANDPIWPMRTSSIANIIGPASASVSFLTLRQLRAEDSTAQISLPKNGIVVSDAETESDLDQLVRIVRNHPGPPAWIGSNGLLAALMRVERQSTAASGRLYPPPPILPGRAGPFLIVCGSQHPQSHRQIDYFANVTGHAVETATVRDFDANSLAKSLRQTLAVERVAALRLSPSERADPSHAMTALDCLFRLFSRDTPFASVFLTGGETALTVCRALGGLNLAVSGQREEGVVESILKRTNNQPNLKVFTKPGGYSHEDILARIHQSLSSGFITKR